MISFTVTNSAITEERKRKKENQGTVTQDHYPLSIISTNPIEAGLDKEINRKGKKEMEYNVLAY